MIFSNLIGQSIVLGITVLLILLQILCLKNTLFTNKTLCYGYIYKQHKVAILFVSYFIKCQSFEDNSHSHCVYDDAFIKLLFLRSYDTE